MLKGFKDFLLRGNVIDLSVAVVIGAAFTAVVTAFTESFLKPLIQLLSPGGDQFRGTFRVSGVRFDYASFINQAITFFITASVVYFLVVAPMKALQNRRLRGEEEGPAQPTDVELLTQIRDLLEAQATAPDDGRGPVPPAPSVPARTYDVGSAPTHPATPPGPPTYAAPAGHGPPGRPTRPVTTDGPPRHARSGVR
jgi:large conductance mechanosensitive channel